MSKQRIYTLIKLASKTYLKRDLDNALKFAMNATMLASLDDTFEDWGDLYAIYGKIKSLKGRYESSDDLLNDALESLKEAKQYFKYSPNLCLEIGKIYLFKQDFDNTLRYFNNSLTVSKEIENQSTEISALVSLADFYVETRNLEETAKYLTKAKKLLDIHGTIDNWIYYHQISITLGIRQHNFEAVDVNSIKMLELSRSIKDIENEIKALNGRGVVHAVRGNYKQAFENFWDSNDKSEAIGYRLLVVRALMNIGNIFSSLCNYEEALKQHLKVIHEYPDQIDNYTLTVLCHNIGGTYVHLDNPDKALEYYLKGLEAAEKEKIHKLEAIILYEISKIYADKDLTKALYYVDKTRMVLETYQISAGIEMHSINLAEIYYKQGKFEEALNKGLEGLELCQKVKSNKTLVRAYLLLSKTYKILEDYKNALHYHELYFDLQNTLHQKMRKKQMLDLEIRYETKEKEQEIKLLTTNMELQKLELQHTDKVKAQNELIQQANQEVKQFTYAVSHDLKEPLRMIGSFTQLVGHKVKKLNDKRLNEYMAFITDGVVRMDAMLGGMLNYAELGNQTNLNTEINLNQTISDVLLNLRVRIQESKAVVNVDSMPNIRTNKVLISQLFQNLIANAIKFCKKDVTPIINITMKEEEKQFIFSVQDNGIGIPEKQQKSVFALFSRLHTREQFEGTGIGLAMCKKITQIVQGHIWLESEVGVGTTFHITIPKMTEPILIEK